MGPTASVGKMAGSRGRDGLSTGSSKGAVDAASSSMAAGRWAHGVAESAEAQTSGEGVWAGLSVVWARAGSGRGGGNGLVDERLMAAKTAAPPPTMRRKNVTDAARFHREGPARRIGMVAGRGSMRKGIVAAVALS
jgi:hypothetical protein